MRIVAAVFIFIVAVLDLLASLPYLGIGSLAVGGGAGLENLSQAEKDAKKKAEAQEGAKALQAGGSVLLFIGLFLLAMFGLGIACGVVLIMARAQLFALTVGVGQIAIDAITCYLWGHVGITNILAFVAGALVIIAALTYPKARPVATA